MNRNGIAPGTLRGDLVVPDGPVFELGTVEILHGLIVDDINGLLGRQPPISRKMERSIIFFMGDLLICSMQRD